MFPDSFGEINHTKLYVSVGNYNEGRVYFPFADGITNDELQKEFRNNIENNFQQEIASMECTKLLISSEAFSKLLFEVHDVQSLKNFLDNFVNKYKIIIYLRPQHEYAISSYKTLLGSGIEKKNVLGEPSDNPIWNYDHLLSKWENVFGTENIIPRIFSKNEFPDGDIKKDFISILKLDFSDFDDVKSLNESVSADALRFMLEINRYLPVFINNKRNKNRGNISRLVFSKSHGKGLLPTREQAINFFNYFTKSNEKVREKWFPERKELFKVDFTKYPEKAQEYPEIDYNAFEIFAELWSHNQKVRLVNDYIIEGQMCIINEQYEKALSHLEEALKIRPNHTMILQSLAYALIKLQRFKDSEEYLNKAIMLEPNNPQLRKLQEKLETNKND